MCVFMIRINKMLTSLLYGTGLILSISLSDGIEYYTNPLVHMLHNRFIVNVPWKKYNFYYAAKSGFKCSWFLVLPFCIISSCLGYKTIPIYYYFLYIFNICLPLALRIIQGTTTPSNMYLGHQLLYLTNPLVLLLMVINNS